MIGTMLKERYRIEAELGRGGMGEVYRATDIHSGEVVAVKALNAEVLARDPDLLARFIREGEALRLLNHPNIVRMIAAVEENGKHYLAMEFVEGGSLHDVLLSRKSLPASEVIKIALEVSDALSRAHHLGIIHRDLKPANVLIAKDGTPRLADFGIAHLESDQHLTQTGVLVGTVDYVSPEVCQGKRPDERSDIWAFGVMLFEMLSGRLPFEGNTLTSRLTAILTQPVPDLSQLVPDVSPSFINLINRMLEKDPQQRIPSVRMVGAELEGILKGREPVTPSRPVSIESHFETPTPSPQKAEHNHPTGTVTFLFSDIEGSTKRWEHQPELMQTAFDRQERIMRAAMTAHGGYVYKMIGDAFQVAFATAPDALAAALDAQRGLGAEEWGEIGPIRVRMALYTGVTEERGDDYVGPLLNRVARLMSAGYGGQVLLTQAAYELVRDHLPKGAQIRDLGEHRLKDLIQPEHVYQVNASGLQSDFPTLKTLDVQLNNLPAQPTPFVGREREITAVLGLLSKPDVRLVTLTGAGGTGKTRLSLQVAADLLDEYEHGVWFVELASIANPELVLPTIASILNVKESAGTSIEQALHEYLSKRNLLLVIDNFEQVVSAAPGIGKLLAAAPKVKVLTSSREILRLRGEHDYPVPPLGLPESKRKQTAAVLAQYEAIALFVQHARAANSAFELNEENALIVAEICMKLDGLPLAIELTAARSKLLKPAVMLEKLKSRLDLLVSKARDLPQRQQTIRGAIDWSYELLDEAEKILFSHLGVFVGGWTVESAEAVCGVDAFSGLESLLDKSLLRQFDGVSGETRFTMLETIREYAMEKLTQSGEFPAIQQAHLSYMGQFLQRVFDSHYGSDETSWYIKLDDELVNVRVLVDGTLARGQPSLAFKAVRIWHYWDFRMNYRDPVVWMERALAVEDRGNARERAQALAALGHIFGEYGNRDKEYLLRARKCQAESMDLYREVGDTEGIARSLTQLGNLLWKGKEIEAARKCFEQVLEMQPGVISGENAMALLNLGSLAMVHEDYQQALAYYLRSQEIYLQMESEKGRFFAEWFLGKLALAQRQLGEVELHINLAMECMKTSPQTYNFLEGYLGYVQILRGNQHEGRRIFRSFFEQLLETYEQMSGIVGDIGDDWYLYDGQARLELMEKHYERAAQLFGVAFARRGEGSYPIFESERSDYDACISEIRAAIGDAVSEAAFERGRMMNIKDALEFVLKESE